MRVRLAQLSSSTLDSIVQLEANNMLPVLASIGIFITVEEIRAAIQKDPSQFVLASFDRSQLSAVIRYKIEDGHIFINSIQFADSAKGLKSLKSILSIALDALTNESLELVESVAQITNPTSIALHEKLGFRRKTENSQSIRFTILREKLVVRLQQILRK